MNTNLPPSRAEHLEEVRAWLDRNTVVVPPDDQLELVTINIDWDALPDDLRGHVGTRGNDAFDLPPLPFWIDIAGKPVVSTPMYHSPLGAPASYPAVRISEPQLEAVGAQLRAYLPPIRPVLWTDDGPRPIKRRIAAEFDFPAWESRLRKSGGELPASGPQIVSRAEPAGESGEVKLAPRTWLLVQAMLLMTAVVWVLLLPFDLIRRSLSAVDAGAIKMRGTAYTNARDRAAELLYRAIVTVVVVCGIVMVLATCSKSMKHNGERDCDYASRGAICGP